MIHAHPDAICDVRTLFRRHRFEVACSARRCTMNLGCHADADDGCRRVLSRARRRYAAVGAAVIGSLREGSLRFLGEIVSVCSAHSLLRWLVLFSPTRAQLLIGGKDDTAGSPQAERTDESFACVSGATRQG